MSVISQFTGVPYSGIPVTVTGTSFDCRLGTYFEKTVGAGLEETFTFTNAPSGKAFLLTMSLTIAAGATVIWPVAISWQFSVPFFPEGSYILSFLTVDGGSSWVASSIYSAYTVA